MTTQSAIESPETAELTLENINEAPATTLVIPERFNSVIEPSVPTPETVESVAEQPVLTPEQIAAAQAAQASPEVLQQRLQLLGSITWLMLQSSLHRNYPILELETQILPSLMLDQFRYYEIKGQPVGFMNWAYLSEEIEEQYQTGDYQLSAEDWQSGERLWCPEFIAPFGHAQNMVDDLRENIFPESTAAKTFQVNEDGTRSIVEYTLDGKS